MSSIGSETLKKLMFIPAEVSRSVERRLLIHSRCGNQSKKRLESSHQMEQIVAPLARRWTLRHFFGPAAMCRCTDEGTMKSKTPPSRRPDEPPPIRLLPFLPLKRPTPPPPRQVVEPGERVVRGGKVLFYPAPNGSVKIVGLDETGEWVAEFACRAKDFDEKYIRRMERHVATTTGVRIAIV